MGRDAGLAGGAGAAGLGAYEAGKHHHNSNPAGTTHEERSFPLGGGSTGSSHPTAGGNNDTLASALRHPNQASTSSANPSDFLGSSTSSGTHQPHDSHLGRDAALAGGAGAAGLGAREAGRHHDHSHGTHPTSNTLAGGAAPTTQQHNPLSSTHGSTQQPHDSHLGRDAAIGTGAGAAGIAAERAFNRHEHPGAQTSTGPTTGTHGQAGMAAAASSFDHNHGGHGHQFGGDPCGPNKPPAGPHFTQGPHITDTANRLDPRVSGDAPPAGLGSSTTSQHPPGGAALGGAGLGAATGAGASALPHRHPDHTTERGLGGPTTASSATDPSSQHHYGRDAALAGGAGAAGLGAYEAGKHHGHEGSRDAPGMVGGTQQYTGQQAGPTSTDPAPNTTGPHKSDVLNVVDPRVKPEPEKMKGHTATSTSQDPASKTVGPHDSNIANVMDPRVKPDPAKMKGHQTGEATEKSPYSTQPLDPRLGGEKPQEHHYGRDAALAGGAGAAGLGAYEASKHHGDDRNTLGQSREDPLHSTTQRSTQPTSTLGSTGPTGTHTTGQEPGKEHHYGRDAAVAGGAGAVGLGGYEAAKHHGDNRDAQRSTQPTGTLGAGQTAPTSTQRDPLRDDQKHHGHGKEAAAAGLGAGAVGAGAYEYSKHDQKEAEKEAEKQAKQHEKDLHKAEKKHEHDAAKHHDTHEKHHAKEEKPSLMDKILHGGKTKEERELEKEQKEVEKEGKHHTGRDAAIAGGAGAAGVGAYEAEKHHGDKHDTQQSTQTVAGQKDTIAAALRHPNHASTIVSSNPSDFLGSSNPTGTAGTAGTAGTTGATGTHMTGQEPGKEHHYGRDAAVAGGAGALGTGAVVEHEKNKHEHNKLHKDPPPGYMEDKMAGQSTGGQRIGTDGPIGDANKQYE